MTSGERRRLLFLCLGLLTVVARGQELLSALPLDGNLVDRATGTPAEFVRTSEAYTKDGAVLPAGTPRFERLAIAAGYEWRDIDPDTHLCPIAIVGNELFATDERAAVWASTDGQHFEKRYQFPRVPPKPIMAWGTPGGALLVNLLAPDYSQPATLYRSADGGRTFTPVLTLHMGFVEHWNFAALGDLIFVSEYGYTSETDNPRLIYRSDDDGQTWQVVYDPGFMPNHHMHQIVADPYRGCIYQAFAHTPEMILRSCDNGLTWESIHNFYMGTSAVVRPDGVYWGNDGGGGNAVSRYDPLTGRWTSPCRPWGGYADNLSRPHNVYAMLDADGIMYAAEIGYNLQMGTNDLWASEDGQAWTSVRCFPVADYGLLAFAGSFAGWIHARYTTTWTGNIHHLQYRPGHLRTHIGLRIEPAMTNLLAPNAASFEGGLGGWTATTPIQVSQERAYHGRSSLRITNPAGLTNVAALSPVITPPLPVGTTVRGHVHITGDEGRMLVYFRDMSVPGSENGPQHHTAPCDDWIYTDAEMTVTHPQNRIQLLVRCMHNNAEWPNRDWQVWIDGVQVSTTLPGVSWHAGGESRAAETVRLPVTWPDEWTDFLYVRPEFDSTVSSDDWYVFKAWSQSAEQFAALVFDPIDDCFKVVEKQNGHVSIIAQSDPVFFFREHGFQFVVRKGLDATDLRVRVGACAADDITACGGPLHVNPTTVWIGSTPGETHQAPGVYALHRTYAGALSDELVERHLGLCAPQDLNRDGAIDHDDVIAFATQLHGPDSAWLGAASAADSDEDGDVDLVDLADYQRARN